MHALRSICARAPARPTPRWGRGTPRHHGVLALCALTLACEDEPAARKGATGGVAGDATSVTDALAPAAGGSLLLLAQEGEEVAVRQRLVVVGKGVRGGCRCAGGGHGADPRRGTGGHRPQFPVGESIGEGPLVVSR